MERDMRKGLLFMPVMAVLLALLSLGCSIFEPRDAETPGSEGTPFIAPDVPSLVFSNMKSGLEDLTGVNYEKSLGDAFTFIPLPADEDALGPEVYQDWTKAVEMNVTNRILADASNLLVSFINPEQIRDEADFADFRAPYELTVTYSSGDTETFKGVAQFDMQRLGGNWYLIRWTDQEGVEGFATWGYLRGLTRGTSL
jgi:hypothetical protein